jgi:hypothetical protein
MHTMLVIIKFSMCRFHTRWDGWWSGPLPCLTMLWSGLNH